MKAIKNEKQEIKIGNKIISSDTFTVIAGPCSVESVQQMDIIFKELNVDIIRGGSFKPRTSPYDFQGLGAEALLILKDFKNRYNKPVISEIMSIEQLDLFDDIDIIQVGARNMQNFELLKTLGKIDKPILLKRGMGNTIEEFIASAEYIIANGNKKVIMCERGIRTFSNEARFTLDLACIHAIKTRTNLPIFVDPSHAAGTVELVEPLALAAVAAGCNGLIIEVHPNPNEALSDKNQQLTIEEFNKLKTKVDNVYNQVK